jgi:uncharacterized protein YcfJ
MKNVIAIATALLMTATAVYADGVQGRVIGMKETYREDVQSVPVQTCNTVNVPIYETRRTGQASSGDALVGAIIGGVIGNQFGNGKGKDAMTVLGAIVGADKVNKKGKQETVIVGYREERQCSTTHHTKKVSKVRGANMVTLEINGQAIQLYTQNWYRIGSIVTLTINM